MQDQFFVRIVEIVVVFALLGAAIFLSTRFSRLRSKVRLTRANKSLRRRLPSLHWLSETSFQLARSGALANFELEAHSFKPTLRFTLPTKFSVGLWIEKLEVSKQTPLPPNLQGVEAIELGPNLRAFFLRDENIEREQFKHSAIGASFERLLVLGADNFMFDQKRASMTLSISKVDSLDLANLSQIDDQLAELKRLI